MELHARHKRKEGRVPQVIAPMTGGESRAERDSPRYSITVRYDTLLYDTLQNMIRSAHTAQDFTYTSLADFIRAAAPGAADSDGVDQNGPKMETSLRVERDLWLFYKSLPGRKRSKLLERAIRTFMRQSTVGRD